MEEIKFALDTFYAVMAGALVMWMAAGFTMLEAGMIQSKNASAIVTKNLGLYSIACIMYLMCGFIFKLCLLLQPCLLFLVLLLDE